MRILLFSTLFPHRGEPTLGIFVENRLKNLLAQEKDISATVIAPVPWFPFKGKIFGAYGRAARAETMETRDGLTIYHPRYLVIPKIGMLLTPFFLYWSAWRCLRRLKQQGNKFDLIDAHYLYPDAVSAARLAGKAGLPFVATARGSDVTQIGTMPKPRKRIVAAVNQAAHAITVSENLRRDLISMGIAASHISTLRNGVDLVRFHETERALGRRDVTTKHVLLFAGWLIPRKRLDIVLEVTAKLPEVTTVIVGDGPLMAECRARTTRLGIESRVVFAGQQQPTEMPKFFSMADVLLLPSDREGWANVLLEAMACGTPVVSRAIGGAPDLIKSDVAGRVVDSDQPEVIARAVKEVLDQPPARSRVRDYAARYDWVETSSAQRKIFSTAIEKHTKR